MKVHSVEFDLEKAAHDIGLAYAKKSLEPDFVPEEGDIETMIQAYAQACLQVLSMDEKSIEALVH